MIKLHKSQQIIPCLTSETLMAALLRAGMPVASSCGGEGVCGKCKVQVVAGSEHLSAIGDSENFLHQRYKLKANERISCQVYVSGDCEIDTTYW